MTKWNFLVRLTNMKRFINLNHFKKNLKKMLTSWITSAKFKTDLKQKVESNTWRILKIHPFKVKIKLGLKLYLLCLSQLWDKTIDRSCGVMSIVSRTTTALMLLFIFTTLNKFLPDVRYYSELLTSVNSENISRDFG